MYRILSLNTEHTETISTIAKFFLMLTQYVNTLG